MIIIATIFCLKNAVGLPDEIFQKKARLTLSFQKLPFHI